MAQPLKFKIYDSYGTCQAAVKEAAAAARLVSFYGPGSYVLHNRYRRKMELWLETEETTNDSFYHRAETILIRLQHVLKPRQRHYIRPH